MNLLTMKNIHKAYTDKVLFKGADFSVNSGDKIGVIGINGTGKSTLLKMIAGLDTCDAGLVVRGNNIVVNYLPQSPTFDDNETIYEHVITANSTKKINGALKVMPEQFLISSALTIPVFRFPPSPAVRRKKLHLLPLCCPTVIFWS